MNDTAESPLREDHNRAKAKELISPLITMLEAYDIPDEKVEAVVDYTVTFFAKHFRHMNNRRMLRKIVEYFHLQPKVIEDESDQI